MITFCTLLPSLFCIQQRTRQVNCEIVALRKNVDRLSTFFFRRATIPVGTWRWNNIKSSFNLNLDVDSTSVQCSFKMVCLLGILQLTTRMTFLEMPNTHKHSHLYRAKLAAMWRPDCPNDWACDYCTFILGELKKVPCRCMHDFDSPFKYS
jgi:hypothetical protein